MPSLQDNPRVCAKDSSPGQFPFFHLKNSGNFFAAFDPIFRVRSFDKSRPGKYVIRNLIRKG